jgi:hypothetical protein
MKRLLALVTPVVLFAAMSCNEPNTVESSRPPVTPPASTSVTVNLTVGNTYIWRYNRFFNNGSFQTWQQTVRITSDTLINGVKYFVFDTGERLHCDPDSVSNLTTGGRSVWYRFDVEVGDHVPFAGHSGVVTSVESTLVFSETKKVVSVIADTASTGSFDTGSYAAKFGLVSIRTSAGTSVTIGTLIGAVLESTSYSLSLPE